MQQRLLVKLPFLISVNNTKLLRSTSLWRCLFFNFAQFVNFENLSVLDLVLSELKGLKNLQARSDR